MSESSCSDVRCLARNFQQTRRATWSPVTCKHLRHYLKGSQEVVQLKFVERWFINWSVAVGTCFWSVQSLPGSVQSLDTCIIHCHSNPALESAENGMMAFSVVEWSDCTVWTDFLWMKRQVYLWMLAVPRYDLSTRSKLMGLSLFQMWNLQSAVHIRQTVALEKVLRHLQCCIYHVKAACI